MEREHKPPLIVVADDDDMQRFLFEETLRAAGYEVACVEDGDLAVAAVAELRPALVVLDVVMRQVDGFTACRRIRALPGGEHLPILMVTGLDDTRSIERAFREGATDFLAKPINWALLGHRVRYMLRAAGAFADIRASRQLLAEAERVALLGSWRWDRDAARLLCSAGACRLLGLPELEAILPPAAFFACFPAAERKRLSTALEGAVAQGGEVEFECRLEGNGEERVIVLRAAALPDANAIRGTLQDVTERHLAEARLQHLAHHDALTGLLNRSLLADRLGQAIRRAKREGSVASVLCLDLDRFKEVNDTLGHAAGDRLLQAVAERLSETVRGSDTLARLGGDEFIIVQVGASQAEAMEPLAKRVLAALARPIRLADQEMEITASIGAAVYPDDGTEPGELIMRADMALYAAKAAGRGIWRRFHTDMDDSLRARRELEQLLRAALAEGWFELHYQPQMALADEQVVGVEALLRLRHPQRGLVSPAEFVPLAEETALIVPIGEWVLRTACAQAAAWHARLPSPIRVAVNLSPIQLRQKGFVDQVAAILRDTGLPPQLLELEITEGMLMHDTPAMLDKLKQLRALGVAIALDDFGTGYSSLGYLRVFPFDRLKIDRSFVEAISQVDDAAAIVRSILDLSRSLGLKTTAEGVETQAQLAHLRREACDEAQGFYFGRPMPAEAIEMLLHGRQERRREPA